jgi:hypothetical protein
MESDQPKARFKGTFEHIHVAYAYNTTDYEYSEKRQSGGTMILSQGMACHRVLNWGFDDRKLGRWTWVRYRSHESPLRIVVVYRPVQSTNIHGAYNQQKTFFLSLGITTCPRTQFLIDLQQKVFFNGPLKAIELFCWEI